VVEISDIDVTIATCPSRQIVQMIKLAEAFGSRRPTLYQIDSESPPGEKTWLYSKELPYTYLEQNNNTQYTKWSESR